MSTRNEETRKAIQEYGLEKLSKLQGKVDGNCHSFSLWHYTEDGVTIYDTNEVHTISGGKEYPNRNKVDIFVDGQSWYSSEDAGIVFAVMDVINRSFNFALSYEDEMQPLKAISLP